ncbi:hypothetical protein [Paraburkholderia hospita]|uniref:hypothetical protein n=1 Tax=Paraburkholderia hospita TaxID=169430 RepID=UPI0008A784D4|nr:hypothetical protein [Paraburkholderia hospita]SEH89879.1 hypothetical protein SAMN05192544_1011154 [Paraburkholderia hospita]
MARGDINSSQIGGTNRGDAVGNRALEVTIVRVLNSKFGLSERAVQQIQELAGLRGIADDGTRPNMAVKRGDFGPLLRVPAPSSKAAAGATPTAAEYNALRDDVLALFEAFGLIAQAVAQTGSGQ